jgi:bifunctional non-homologous end joining protein LigD
LLPLLKGRPTLLVRYPDGIEGKSFFQWNPPADAGRHVRALRFRDGEHKSKSAFLIDDVAALAYVINLGCIPLHILSYRESSREHCDFLTVDFDVGDQPFGHAVQLARSLGGILEEIGLVGFPKTSGQTGLHVLVALGPNVAFESAKMLAEILGRLLLARHPDLATMERMVSKRGPRVYVDTGQTGRSRAIVAPYSVRAWSGATVSTPLAWQELSLALDPRAFTIRTVPERLAAVGDLARGLLTENPNLEAAMARLEQLLHEQG